MNRIVMKAIENVVKIFGSKRNLGKQVGETAAIVFREAVIVGGARVALTKVKEIFIDQNGNVKDQGPGTVVAIMYQGDDGNYYKEADNKMYAWNGSEWV
jgi:hypothetical protein